MSKHILTRAGIKILNIIYSVFKARKNKKQITLVSRESNKETLDLRMLREALQQSGQYKIVVLSKKLEKSFFGILLYSFHMIRQMWNFAVSEAVVTDTYCIALSVLKHKNSLQKIQIWHAVSAIKKFGYQTIGKKDGSSAEIAEIMSMHKNYDYVISPAQITDKHFSEAFAVSQNKIVRFGLPRIDYIRNTVPKKFADIYEDYPQLKNGEKKTVLYAPTMRKGRGVDLTGFLDVFDDELYNVVVKLHPLDDVTYKIEKENVIYDYKFMAYDFLSVTDIVISDYSSFSVEASLLDIPLYFYLYDYDEYIAKTGINIDFTVEAISCYVSKNPEELKRHIEAEYDFSALHDFRDKYIDKDLSMCTTALSRFIQDIAKSQNG